MCKRKLNTCSLTYKKELKLYIQNTFKVACREKEVKRYKIPVSVVLCYNRYYYKLLSLLIHMDVDFMDFSAFADFFFSASNLPHFCRFLQFRAFRTLNREREKCGEKMLTTGFVQAMEFWKNYGILKRKFHIWKNYGI